MKQYIILGLSLIFILFNIFGLYQNTLFIFGHKNKDEFSTNEMNIMKFNIIVTWISILGGLILSIYIRKNYKDLTLKTSSFFK